MSRVHRRDTVPELLLRRTLWSHGVRGWRVDYPELPGRPDLAFRRARVAVFVDGAFWHGHPSRFTPGQSGKYWDEKIGRNRERDRRVTAELEADGWRVVRVWDFEVLSDSDEVARMIHRILHLRR
jgi:DNA mismatch endonuclease (patch repair protein)